MGLETSEVNRSGWVRLVPEFHPEAVTWWFFREFDDGFCYSRGGRCRSVREARSYIRQCWDDSLAERRAYRKRATHKLEEDGSLVPIHLASTIQEVNRVQ